MSNSTSGAIANSATDVARGGHAGEFYLDGNGIKPIARASVSITSMGGPIRWMATGMIRFSTPLSVAVIYVPGADTEIGGGMGAGARVPFTLMWLDEHAAAGTHTQAVNANIFGTASAYVYVKDMVAIELKR